MECCICYEKNNIITTSCNHYICLLCLNKLNKIECPYCRGKLDNLPEFIKNKINNNSESVTFGNVGYGIFWDAPGTPYGDLSDNIKSLLDDLKKINYNLWNNIRHDINNNNKGKFYNEFFLKDLIDEILNSIPNSV